ncbi:MAG: diacylglycerol kinase family lipid kinase [Planctomycetota bacterium]
MRAYLIINPASGADEPVLSVVNRELAEAGIEWEPGITQRDEDAYRFAQEAGSRDDIDVIAVYGGDGTVTAVASGLLTIGSKKPLAILPGGTGNCIAQELGIPVDLEAATALLRPGAHRMRSLDAIAMKGRHFLLRVGVGADAEMIRAATREQKDQLGWLAYFFGALNQRRAEPARYEIRLDDEVLEAEAIACLVANIGRIGRAGIRLSQEIDPSDGKLDLMIIRNGDWSTIAALGASVLGLEGEEPADPDAPLLHRQAERVSILCDPQQPVHGDGDPHGETPLEIEVLANALELCVPLE